MEEKKQHNWWFSFNYNRMLFLVIKKVARIFYKLLILKLKNVVVILSDTYENNIFLQIARYLYSFFNICIF